MAMAKVFGQIFDRLDALSGLIGQLDRIEANQGRIEAKLDQVLARESAVKPAGQTPRSDMETQFKKIDADRRAAVAQAQATTERPSPGELSGRHDSMQVTVKGKK